MILIGTSGSTKCDWRLLSEGVINKSFSGKGINPFVHTEQDIVDNIQSADHYEEYKDYVKVVYLYSAGCPSKPLRAIVQRALSRIFPRAYHYVNHDIVAAALATYDKEPAITGILGTGSNSCYFDGDIVKQEVAALDYVLGDEGGGTYYGKNLLRSYFYKKMPKDLASAFKDRYSLTSGDILDKIYIQPHANVYLASFMTFVEEHKNHEYIQEMLENGMNEYLASYILPYKNYATLKCHFVGSIAANYEDILRSRAGKLNITVDKIIKEPINGLVDYLIKKHY